MLDGHSYQSGLPWSIEALFYPSSAPSTVVAQTRRIHRDFLRQHGLTADDVPLLRLRIQQNATSSETRPKSALPADAPTEGARAFMQTSSPFEDDDGLD